MQTTLYTGLSLTLVLCLALAAQAAAPERPSWMPPPPPLPVTGRIVNVSDEPQLRAALSGAKDGDTIMLADGVYRLPRFLELQGRRGVVVRSASGDAKKVTIRGLGWDSDTTRDDLLRIRGCTDVTIAFITFADCHAYGVKLEQTRVDGRQLRNINIHGCNFLNIGTRAIKGTGGGGGFVDGGSIRCCTFENTKIPPRTWYANGDYISSIDCMRLKDWVIADNYFKNVRGANGGGRGAIFVWVESRNVISERNVFVNCDRSICYGNPSGSSARPTGPHNTGGVIRNNFIVTGADTGIEICWADGVKVYHNTVLTPSERGGAIHYHWQQITDIEISSNLVRGRIHGDEGGVTKAGNITSGVEDKWFKEAAAGDLHLTAAATPALGAVDRLPACPEDFDGEARGAKGTDAGADQR